MAGSKLVPGFWGNLETENKRTRTEIEALARGILDQMSLDEKIAHMSGDTPLFRGSIQMLYGYNLRPLPAGENLRLGIPGIRFSDGPRGVVMYHSSCFPVSMARGASWDIDLEERIGDAIGVEARTQGANFFGGVCINLLRHPAWGRAQETYGEDPYHLGEMGAALVRGVQRHIMACIKHYACNSIENTRFKVDVRIDERTLREIYLPHFKRCIDEGASAVMSAYNKVNGQYCGHNSRLLREILKQEWKFDGFVISDFMFGIRDGDAAARAGLDIEMPFTMHYGKKLKKLVEVGQVPEEMIDEAVLRILRQKIRFTQIGEPERYTSDAVLSERHRALAREAAQKSIVLLKNDPRLPTNDCLLPIDRSKVKRIAVIGHLANKANTGDKGSSMVRALYVVTPLDGIKAALGDQVEVLYQAGHRLRQAMKAAQEAEIAIVIVGYTHQDEGEYIRFMWFTKGGDRNQLTLSRKDEKLIEAIASVNPNTVVVMIGGSAIITESWRARVPAILMAWYVGMEGGHALADILFGDVNPSAKLPCTFPKSTEHLPFFNKDAETIEYGYLHGYRLLNKEEHEPAFPFGFGLSYTNFEYSNLHLSQDKCPVNGSIEIHVDLSNAGGYPGEEVAQLYVGYEGSQVERPIRELKRFQKIKLKVGETRRLTFTLSAQDLAYYDPSQSKWIVEPILYKVYVGPCSRLEYLLVGEFRVFK